MVRSVSMMVGPILFAVLVYPYTSLCAWNIPFQNSQWRARTWHAQKLLLRNEWVVEKCVVLLSRPQGGEQWVSGHVVKAALQQQWRGEQSSRFWGKMIFNWEFCTRVSLPFKCESTIKTFSETEGLKICHSSTSGEINSVFLGKNEKHKSKGKVWWTQNLVTKYGKTCLKSLLIKESEEGEWCTIWNEPNNPTWRQLGKVEEKWKGLIGSWTCLERSWGLYSQ